MKINGKRRYLWRAVDHEGEVLESIVTKRRNKRAALKFLRKLMKRHGQVKDIVTDRFASYRAAMRDLGSTDKQTTGRWLNNCVENSHLPFRRRERAMQRFRQMRCLQKFAAVHSFVYNHFNQERSLTSRDQFKETRNATLNEWRSLGAAYVLAGKLTIVAGDIRGHGVAGLFLDREEVRYAIPCREMPGITRSEAATTLRVTYQTINYLIAEDMLQPASMRNPKSRQFVTGNCDGSVERFLPVYDTLGLIARRYSRSSGPFGCHLEANGICPLETPQGISWIFSKRGLEKRIRKLGISLPA